MEDYDLPIDVEFNNFTQWHAKPFALRQGFPTFLWQRDLSAFRQMSMYPFSVSKVKNVPLQHFDRWTCTPKISYDKIFYHD